MVVLKLIVDEVLIKKKEEKHEKKKFQGDKGDGLSNGQPRCSQHLQSALG